MEFHYSDLMPDPYANEYVPSSYVVPSKDAEYAVRSSVLVDGGDRFGVSAVVFDKFQELVWMGNQGGHVTSYYGPSMQRYTSFQVHESEEIRDIITMEQGIYVLTKSMLRHQIRRGIPKHTHKSSNMVDMQCLYQATPTSLLMGGHQDKLIDLDLNKMTEKVVPITEEGCAVLRSGGGSVIACGSASGTVILRDIRCPEKTQHSFKAHEACLSDLDMQGNLLISCGFTHSASGEAVAEPYVKVWDARKTTGSWSVAVASPPLLLHFVPAFSGRAVAVSGTGQVALLHVNAASDRDHSLFQVDTQNTMCSVMDVSSSSQALIFGDHSGHIHLFSPQHNNEPVFNSFSQETEFAQPVDIPTAGFDDKTFQFSSIPLPPLTSGNKWFNELSNEFFKKCYRKPKPIDPEVLKTMKMQGPIGYAPNPRTFKRNEMPYVEDNLEDLNSPRANDIKTQLQPVPKQYQKMDIRYNKHGPNDEIENGNKTGFPGLESTIPNSYCNAMLQVLYYTPPVKATLLAHTCAKEFCLSCELGFLFRMLDTSTGSPCQATNFLRAFRTVPEAAALGLILPDRGPDHRVDLVALVQSWNRFILHQIHYEILETRKKEMAQNANSPPKVRITNSSSKFGNTAMTTMNGHIDEYGYGELEFLGPSTDFEIPDGKEHPWLGGNEDGPDGVSLPNEQMELSNNHHDKEESEISELFAIKRHQLNRCLKCNKEEERDSAVLACALQYPSSRTVKETKGDNNGFVELLLASLSSRRSTPAWCESCRRFSPTDQRQRLKRLPPILAINCGGVTAHEKAYWSKGTQKEAENSKRLGSGKPCRYGLHCARPGCRFKHPDRPGSANNNSSSKSPTRESNCLLPHRLSIRVTSDGEVVINDKTEQEESPSKENGTKQKKHTELHEDYSLSAAVICVEDNPRNLVAYANVPGGDTHWYMFNDLCIAPVSIEEVVQCSWWWKTPCVLFYTSHNVGSSETFGNDGTPS